MSIDREAIAEIDEDVLLADGLDDAFVGLTENTHAPPRAVYDLDQCVEVLMRRDGMTRDDAEEFLSFNTTCAYVGERTPIYLRRVGVTPPPEPITAGGDRAAAERIDQVRVASGLIRSDEYREAVSSDRFDIVEVLEKYCHAMDSQHIQAVCDRAARVIKQLRQCVLAYKERKSLAKQVEALERRLESADAALFRSMEK